jgi:hypothetical protein
MGNRSNARTGPRSLAASLFLLGAVAGCLDTARTPATSYEGAGLTEPMSPMPAAVPSGAAPIGGSSAGAPPGPGNPPPGGQAPAPGLPAGSPGLPAGSPGLPGGLPGLPGGLPGLSGAPGTPGSDWSYHEVDGAVCRDGSPAGYYFRPGSDPSLLIFLNGGGVCYDDFFCGINPANVNESLPGETLVGATLDQVSGALLPMRQTPPEDGILSRDARNPMHDFSMMFVPYCTGDVFAGTKRDAPVITSEIMPPQQFVGYTNLGLFYDDLDPGVTGAETVVFAGASAGSFGVLLNYDRTQEFFKESEVLAVADSGFAFRDPYLEPCLQKIWRELWALDAILPADCKGCFNADGGGLAEGLGNYLFKQKYKDRLVGGMVSSEQDQIIKLFFSAGLNGCQSSTSAEAVASFLGLGSYPPERYPEGIADFIDEVSGRDQIASYLIAGDLHQHIFRARYFEDNGLGASIADWLGHLLDGDAEHLGH